jgi:dTDP-4-amino-4,6-dideoxygalactose transaminase
MVKCPKWSKAVQDTIKKIENSNAGKAGWQYMGHSTKSLDENKLNFNVKEELKEKLKKLCKLHRIKSIEEQNPKLWNRFIQFMKDARDFMTHPKPDPKEFHDKMNAILLNNNTGEHVNIAIEILKYYYTETKARLPEWIDKNSLLGFPGINVL